MAGRVEGVITTVVMAGGGPGEAHRVYSGPSGHPGQQRWPHVLHLHEEPTGRRVAPPSGRQLQGKTGLEDITKENKN